MKDDSDKHQYFVAHCYLEFTKKGQTDKKSVSARELFVCMVESIDDVEFRYIAASKPEVFVHKASGEELINKFKVD